MISNANGIPAWQNGAVNNPSLDNGGILAAVASAQSVTAIVEGNVARKGKMVASFGSGQDWLLNFEEIQ